MWIDSPNSASSESGGSSLACRLHKRRTLALLLVDESANVIKIPHDDVRQFEGAKIGANEQPHDSGVQIEGVPDLEVGEKSRLRKVGGRASDDVANFNPASVSTALEELARDVMSRTGILLRKLFFMFMSTHTNGHIMISAIHALRHSHKSNALQYASAQVSVVAAVHLRNVGPSLIEVETV
ncbi:hypothetical protein LXL04_016181 [Taraxacum kok-saghyz]